MQEKTENAAPTKIPTNWEQCEICPDPMECGSWSCCFYGDPPTLYKDPEVPPTIGYAVEHKPKRTERFWRWLGFRFHLGEESNPGVYTTGWRRTDTHLHLGIADRLRILVSGKLSLSVSTEADKEDGRKIYARFDWQIIPPGGKWRS